MEESEKRRQRLNAMHMEAAEVEVSNGQVATARASNLPNPLLDGVATPSAPQDRCAAPRFDFYTDPMAAFSNSKKRNHDSNLNRQGYISPPLSNSSPMSPMSSSHSAGASPNLSPAPNQFYRNYSSDQTLYQTPLPVPLSSSWRGGVPSPFSGHRGTSAGVSGGWNHSGSSPGYRGGRFHNPEFGRGSSGNNSGRGNFHRFNNMPSPGSGRTNGRGNMPSPGSGRSNGRGRGFHPFVQAREQPGLFYRKSMVEDPWRCLKPVVRSSVILQTPNSQKSWLPNSLTMKKAKVSGATGFSSRPSLAERLSHAFEMAAKDVDHT